MAGKSTAKATVAKKIPIAKKEPIPGKRILESEVKSIMMGVVPDILADLFKKELSRVDFLLKKEVEKFHNEAGKELIKSKDYISAETDKRLREFDAKFSKEISKIINEHARKFNSKLSEFKELQKKILDNYKTEFEKNSVNLENLQKELVNKHIRKADEVIMRFEEKNKTILDSHTKRFQTILEKINKKERRIEKENEARLNAAIRDLDDKVKSIILDNKRELSEVIADMEKKSKKIADDIVGKVSGDMDRFVKSINKNMDNIDREIEKKLKELPKFTKDFVDNRMQPLVDAIDRLKNTIASHDTMVAELSGDVKDFKPLSEQITVVQNQMGKTTSLISTHDQILAGLRSDLNAIDFSGEKAKIEEFYQDVRALRKDFAILDRQVGEVQSEDITRKDEFIQLKNKVDEVSARGSSMMDAEQKLAQLDARVKYVYENLQKVIDYLIKTKQQF